MATAFSKKSLLRANKPPEYSIADYVQDLYRCRDTPRWLTSGARHEAHAVPVSREEVEDALQRTGVKAVGVDGLGATLLKDKSRRDLIVTRLVIETNHYLSSSQYPSYMRRALITPLTKRETDGEIATFAFIRCVHILPIISKLVERIFTRRYLEELKSSGGLHPT